MIIKKGKEWDGEVLMASWFKDKLEKIKVETWRYEIMEEKGSSVRILKFAKERPKRSC